MSFRQYITAMILALALSVSAVAYFLLSAVHGG